MVIAKAKTLIIASNKKFSQIIKVFSKLKDNNFITHINKKYLFFILYLKQTYKDRIKLI